jgi:predicted polyphosphate/ATP-dependent NAD kinase
MPRFYDPNQTPDPEEWLRLDEQTRISQAEKYHKKSGVRLPNPKAHATFHAIVENQIALNETAVVRAVERLKKQGLTRHDSIHAITWVLSQHLFDLMKQDDEDKKEVVNARYFAEVERLNAEDWLKQVET